MLHTVEVIIKIKYWKQTIQALRKNDIFEKQPKYLWRI